MKKFFGDAVGVTAKEVKKFLRHADSSRKEEVKKILQGEESVQRKSENFFGKKFHCAGKGDEKSCREISGGRAGRAGKNCRAVTKLPYHYRKKGVLGVFP